MTADHDDSLAHLLRRADAAAVAGSPVESSDVASTVRRRYARRRRLRQAAGTAAAAVAVAVGLGLYQASAARDRAAREVATLRGELGESRRQVAIAEATLARLTTSGGNAARPTATRRLAARRDPLDELNWQREQAALVLVRQGDRLSEDLRLPAPAAVAYRQASETFADTRWGAVAQARLVEMR